MAISRVLILLLLLLPLVFSGCAETIYNTPTAAEIPAEQKIVESNPSAETTTSKPPVSQAQAKDPNEQPVSTGDLFESHLEQTTPTDIDPAVSETNLPAIRTESSAANFSDHQLQNLLDEALDYCQVSQEFWQKGDLENALEALDQAYALMLKVETDDNSKLMQQKEDIRFTISKRIMEIYASRNIVVNGNHKAIPMDLNRHVQAEIDLFTTGREKSFFLNAYKRSGRYRAKIVAALKAAGLPEELSWLPLIESGFKVGALSPARALGLWQFIPSTGYKFGLKRSVYIDERLNPDKSTKAAIAYLKELHSIFGDWATVLAAYNCGEGRVLKVIRDQNINYLDNFWDLYERLPPETARYVPRFLASLHVIKNKEKYGLDAIDLEKAPVFESVTVSRKMSLKNVAKVLMTDAQTLRALNPELRRGLLPPDSYTLNLPPGKGEMLLAKLDTIPISTPPRRAYVYYRIRRGDTLSTIARRYGSSVRSIMLANHLRRNRIVAGKTLKIPHKGYRTIKHKSRIDKQVKTTKPEMITHVVKSGDSLWNLARRYGTTTSAIQKENRLHGTNLSIKQVLKIPAKSASPARTGGTLKIYRVTAGDSPYRIALKHNMTLERFLRINKLTPKSTIFPGQQVYIE